jgi:hypothetical protein
VAKDSARLVKLNRIDKMDFFILGLVGYIIFVVFMDSTEASFEDEVYEKQDSFFDDHDSSVSHSFFDDHESFDFHSSSINPASGLPMIGSVDIEGNPYGSDFSHDDSTQFISSDSMFNDSINAFHNDW